MGIMDFTELISQSDWNVLQFGGDHTGRYSFIHNGSLDLQKFITPIPWLKPRVMEAATISLANRNNLLIGPWEIWKQSKRWMPQDLSDYKSPLTQVKAWCHYATSHYLNQCRHRFKSPYNVTRSQWFFKNDLHWYFAYWLNDTFMRQ